MEIRLDYFHEVRDLILLRKAGMIMLSKFYTCDYRDYPSVEKPPPSFNGNVHRT